MKRRMKLRTQIIIMLIILITIPTSVIEIYNSYKTTKTLKTHIEDSTVDNINWISEIIRENNKINRESIDMLSQDPNVISIFKNADSEKWLMGTLQSFLSTHKDVLNVFYGLKDGRMLLRPQQELPEGYDPRERDWYKSAVEKNGQIIITNPYEDAIQKGTYIITFAKAVKDSENGEIIGVVGIDVKLAQLSDKVSKLNIGNNGYAAIIDSTGTVIAHKDSKLLGKNSKTEKWIEEILASKNNKGEQVINNEKFMTYLLVEKDTSWNIVGFVPEKEITSQINKNRIISFGEAIIFLLLAIIVGAIFANNLAKPINKLLTLLNKISDGDFTVSVEKNNKLSYELELIENSFNKTIKDIVAMINNIIETSKGIKESSEALVTIMEESSAVGEEISKAVQQISEGAQEQAASLDESTKIVTTLGEEVTKAMENANSMVAASKNVRQSTTDGTIVIKSLKEAFTEAANANKELQEEIRILVDNSNKISAITDTIKAITEQTSLLALNASIEAARAGEAGRGFAVVAEEVRKLAEQSADSAQDINNVIDEIKKSVEAVLEKIDLAINLNMKSEKSVELTNSSFEIIEQAARLLQENIDNVNTSLKEISMSKDSVIQKISEIATVSQETAATTEEVSASTEEQAAGLQEVISSAEQLNQLAEKLDEMVKKFKIN